VVEEEVRLDEEEEAQLDEEEEAQLDEEEEAQLDEEEEARLDEEEEAQLDEEGEELGELEDKGRDLAVNNKTLVGKDGVAVEEDVEEEGKETEHVVVAGNREKACPMKS
jgi:hypothetical protein